MLLFPLGNFNRVMISIAPATQVPVTHTTMSPSQTWVLSSYRQLVSICLRHMGQRKKTCSSSFTYRIGKWHCWSSRHEIRVILDPRFPFLVSSLLGNLVLLFTPPTHPSHSLFTCLLTSLHHFYLDCNKVPHWPLLLILHTSLLSFILPKRIFPRAKLTLPSPS